MNNPLLYFTGLLVVMTAASLTVTAAQENSSALLNNTSQKDSDLNNESLGILNATNSTRGNSTNNFTFMIGGDAKVRQTNSSRIHIPGKDPETQTAGRSSFMIKGYVHPIRDATYEGQYLLNAAGLSRGVEGTPHGYATYHN